MMNGGMPPVVPHHSLRTFDGSYTSTMTPPRRLTRRHHYVARFYLSEWTRPQVKGPRALIEYSRRADRLREAPTVPKATGYGWDLYTVPRDLAGDPELTDEIETEFFQKIDNDAARAHRVLLEADLSIPLDVASEVRFAWARFMSATIERGARLLRERDEKAKELLAEQLVEFRSRPLNERARAVVDGLDQSAVSKLVVRRNMLTEIDDRAFLEYLVQGSWLILPAPPGAEFITSDEPIVVNANQKPDRPIRLLSMALDPSRLLVIVATAKDEEERREWAELVGLLPLTHGITLATGPSRYLYAASPITNGLAWGPVTVNLRRVLEEQFVARTLTANDEGDGLVELEQAPEG